MSYPNHSVLTLLNLAIHRGDFILCQGINFELHAGQICHLIGANGTGKTTLLMQLAGLLPVANVLADSIEDSEDDIEDSMTGDTKNKASSLGKELANFPTVQFCGQDCLPLRPVYVSHQLGIHPDLTVKQNLQFLLELYDIHPTQEQLTEALTWVALDGYESTPCRQLSAGQTRRVNLARLKLMTTEHSQLWLLDEPLTALDSQMVTRLLERLRAFANTGGAVILTSHQTDNMNNVVDLRLDLSTYVV